MSRIQGSVIVALVLVAGNAGDGDRRPHRLLRGQTHHTRSR